MDDETRTDNEETQDLADTSAPPEETDETPEDPSAGLAEEIGALRADIASYMDGLAGIKEMLASITLGSSISEEDDVPDTEDEYPEYDMDELAMTIGD